MLTERVAIPFPWAVTLNFCVSLTCCENILHSSIMLHDLKSETCIRIEGENRTVHVCSLIFVRSPCLIASHACWNEWMSICYVLFFPPQRVQCSDSRPASSLLYDIQPRPGKRWCSPKRRGRKIYSIPLFMKQMLQCFRPGVLNWVQENI